MDVTPGGGLLVVNAVTPLFRQTSEESRASAAESPALRECVARAVRRFLKDMGDSDVDGMHALVMAEVEAPLLREVMDHCEGNQSRAAQVLGINRATLRKKLAQYGISF
jgi:Fis family transcriptional regulator